MKTPRQHYGKNAIALDIQRYRDERQERAQRWRAEGRCRYCGRPQAAEGCAQCAHASQARRRRPSGPTVCLRSTRGDALTVRSLDVPRRAIERCGLDPGAFERADITLAGDTLVIRPGGRRGAQLKHRHLQWTVAVPLDPAARIIHAPLRACDGTLLVALEPYLVDPRKLRRSGDRRAKCSVGEPVCVAGQVTVANRVMRIPADLHAAAGSSPRLRITRTLNMILLRPHGGAEPVITLDEGRIGVRVDLPDGAYAAQARRRPGYVGHIRIRLPAPPRREPLDTLVAQAQDGDPAAREQLGAVLLETARKTVRRFRPDEPNPEDLAAHAVADVWRRIAQSYAGGIPAGQYIAARMRYAMFTYVADSGAYRRDCSVQPAYSLDAHGAGGGDVELTAEKAEPALACVDGGYLRVETADWLRSELLPQERVYVTARYAGYAVDEIARLAAQKTSAVAVGALARRTAAILARSQAQIVSIW